MTLEYYRYEINRLTHLEPSESNYRKINNYLSKIRRLSEPDKSIENEVIREVCDIFGVTREDLKAKNNKRVLADARAVIANYLHHKAGYPYRYIGFLIGLKRTSTFHASSRLDTLINVDKQMLSKWKQLNAKLSKEEQIIQKRA